MFYALFYQTAGLVKANFLTVGTDCLHKTNTT